MWKEQTKTERNSVGRGKPGRAYLPDMDAGGGPRHRHRRGSDSAMSLPPESPVCARDRPWHPTSSGPCPFRSFLELPMQANPANTDSRAGWKPGSRNPFAVDEANPGKAVPVFEIDAETLDLPDRIRRQPFATCLIDRGNQGVGDHHVEPALPQGDSSRQAGRAAAHHQGVANVSGSPSGDRVVQAKRRHAGRSPFLVVHRLDLDRPIDDSRFSPIS